MPVPESAIGLSWERYARRLAYHEAGHAVATELLSGRVNWSRISDGINWCALTHSDWTDFTPETRRPLMAQVSLASLVSETLNLGKVTADALARAQDDIELARAHAWETLPKPRPDLETWDSNNLVSEYQHAVNELLGVGENELAIHLLAHALVEHQSLDRPDILEILSLANQNFTEDALHEARTLTEVHHAS